MLEDVHFILLFNIPADQGFHFKPLDMQQLSTYQTKFRCLKVLFIDEISMVGKKIFNFINQRLQEMMGCLEPLEVSQSYHLAICFNWNQ